MRYVVLAKDKGGSSYPLMFWQHPNYVEAKHQFDTIPACDWVQLFEEEETGLNLIKTRTGPSITEDETIEVSRMKKLEDRVTENECVLRKVLLILAHSGQWPNDGMGNSSQAELFGPFL